MKLGFYWKAIFDPMDELSKLTATFNEFAVQEIASQVSQIKLLMEQNHDATNHKLDNLSREMSVLRQEAHDTTTHTRRTSDMLTKMAAGSLPYDQQNLTVIDGVRTTIASFHEQIEVLKKWLKVPAHTEDDFANHKARKMRGTCQWIFDDPLFQSWRSTGDPSTALLWIHAHAGRGKSVLAATIIQKINIWIKGTGNSSVYFFCRSDDDAKKTPHSILRSTAYYLAQRNETIRKRLMHFVSNYPDLRLDELPLPSLWDRLFMSCICDPSPDINAPFTVYWVIDALDECEIASRTTFMKLLTELGEEHCGVSFRLLVLSRFVQDVAKITQAADVPTIEMKPSDNIHDIREFINVNIRSSSLGSLGSKDSQCLIDTLQERANGSFLWVKLVMEELESRRSIRSIGEALTEIRAERSLDNLYQCTLDTLAGGCNAEDKNVAREILMWTLFSARPLTLEELTCAIGESMGTRMLDVERAVKETCGALIEVVQTHSGKHVAAVHQTLRDFMHSGGATGDFAFPPREAHEHIAKASLSHLLRIQFSKPFTDQKDIKMDLAKVSKKYPLLNYASRYWSYHLVAGAENFDHDLNVLVLQFLQSRNVLTCIEAVSTFGTLTPLCRFSENLRTWLELCPKVKPGLQSVLPLAPSSQHPPSQDVLARWSLDFRRLKERFQQSLLRYPRCIHDSLPAFCPTKSMIYKLGSPHAEVSIPDASSQLTEWDNLVSMFRIPGFVRMVVCSPQRPFIASAVDSSVVTIWDAETGQAIRQLKGHTDLVYTLSYSKDDRYLASGGKDEIIKVWQVDRGYEMFEMKGHVGGVYALAYSHSGQYIASGGEDGAVRIWEVSEDGALMRHILKGHHGTVYTLKYHSDDAQLYSSSDDGCIVLWNALKGTPLRKVDVNLKWMGRLSVHPSWHYILVSSEREPTKLQIWNLEICEITSTISSPSPVRCWKYSPKGTYIVTGHVDGRIRVWDAVTTELLHSIHEDAWSLRFSNLGKYLICLIRYISRWQIRTWDFEKEMLERKCEGRARRATEHRFVQSLTVNMDNSRMATVTVPYAGTLHGRVKLWNTNEARVIWEHDQTAKNQGFVSPAFSTDGTLLVCYDAKEGGHVLLVDTSVGTIIECVAFDDIGLVSLAIGVSSKQLGIALREPDELDDLDSVPRFFYLRRTHVSGRVVDAIQAWATQNTITLSYTLDGTKLILGARDHQDNLLIRIWDTGSQSAPRRVTYNEDKYIWFKMFSGFRLLDQDRIVIHVDYISRSALRRSQWRERMLVLNSMGEVEQQFEAGSSRMTISGNRIIFLDSEYWVRSWNGEDPPKPHVKLPVDIGFAVTGLAFSEGKLMLISRTEVIMILEVDSLR
jgi:WD40 repeat protein